MAIITVDKEINFNSRIHPICLDKRGTSYYPGITITVQGWGETGVKKKKVDPFELSTRSKVECDNRIRKSDPENIEKWMPQYTSNGLFCADNDLKPEIGTCNGDSGGPAIQRFDFVKPCPHN